MYYNEDNNHSNQLFHSMIQLARGLGVSNPNHSIMTTNPDPVENSVTDCNYSPVHPMSWPTPSEFETDYQKRKQIGNSLNLFHQIPLDSTFNEVGRYLTNHTDFTQPSNTFTTNSDDVSPLSHTINRYGTNSNVRFALPTNTYTEFVETCQSLTHFKHSDYNDTRTNQINRVVPTKDYQDELINNKNKSTTNPNDFNFEFPPMYTFRHRSYLDTDLIDTMNPDPDRQLGKHSKFIGTFVPKSFGIGTNNLSQYYSNFSHPNTTTTMTNSSMDNVSLDQEYDQKFSYHSIKNSQPNMNLSFVDKSDADLITFNHHEQFDNQYLTDTPPAPLTTSTTATTTSMATATARTRELIPKGFTNKGLSHDSHDDQKSNSFRHIWNQECLDSIISTSTEPETHSLVEFAELFKQKRIKLGATQAEVGRALGDLNYGGFGCLSQSTICRFESLSLSQNNMLALKPILQAWLEQAEKRVLNSNLRYDSCNQLDQSELRHSHCSSTKLDLDDDTTSMLDCAFERKRKRTSITGPEKRSLETYFAIQPRPSSDQLKLISTKLKLPKSVVRVWFCNQRQKQKRLQTMSHAYNGTLVMSTTNDALCGLCKTSSTISSSSPSYHLNQWNRAEKQMIQSDQEYGAN